MRPRERDEEKKGGRRGGVAPRARWPSQRPTAWRRCRGWPTGDAGTRHAGEEGLTGGPGCVRTKEKR
jgi:hypothetical protein